VEPVRVRCVLDVLGGPSRRIGPGGVLIGRQGDCDIVASDPSVSRRHALVRVTGAGVEVVPLGRSPIDVNGEPTSRPRALADGDRLELPGLTLAVAITIPRPDHAARSGFVLVRPGGGSFGIAHTPFVIGGGDADDLIVKKWPERQMSLHVAQGALFVELHAGSASRNGEPLERDTLAELAVGDTLACRDETFSVQAGGPDATTALRGAALPSRVEIEMLPRGGRVVFTVAGSERAVYLADRRFDLVVALARPPDGHHAGEFITDDVLRSVVWPRKPSVTRPEINMLISRCRRDLVEAGLAGPHLIERAPHGGGTRLAVAPGAEIVMKA
jgi:hypothetical protein